MKVKCIGLAKDVDYFVIGEIYDVTKKINENSVYVYSDIAQDEAYILLNGGCCHGKWEVVEEN